MTRVAALVLVAVGVLALGGFARTTTAPSVEGERTQVVVTLASPALGLDPDGARRIDREQRSFRRALATSLPAARARWRYRLVANGFAVDLPPSQVPRLRSLPGVKDVFTGATYGPQLDRSPGQIGAPALWGPTLQNAGQGLKIGIVDTGVDGSVARLDERSGRVVRRTSVPSGSVGSIAVGDDSAWVTGPAEGKLWRVRAGRAESVGAIEMSLGVADLAVAATGIWVTNPLEGTVSRVDPETARVVRTIDLGGIPRSIAVDGETIWITVPMQVGIYAVFGIYSKLWRFVDQKDFETILKATVVGTAGLIGVLFLFSIGRHDPPRSVIVMDFLLSLVFVCGARFAVRWAFERPARGQILERVSHEVLIVGAGNGGQQVAAELASLRQIKDADEVRRLRRAVAITTDAFLDAMAQVKPGMYEYEVEAALEYGFRRRGAERLGFPSIVGSGPNGTILHYDENRRRMEEGELVVIDVGAEYGYYSADLTRTLPVSGRFTARQRRLYDLVLGAQQAAIDSVRPGTSLGTLNQIARTYLRTRSSDLCGGFGCDRYFIHGLSHWLGMDVHDPGSYSRRLEPGMVLTVEPGVYIPAESLGIRIEDVLLVTREGAEVLSSGLPRSIEAVERAMAQ